MLSEERRGKNHTLKCFSFGTPKTINFPFVSNGKLVIFRCPKIYRISSVIGRIIFLPKQSQRSSSVLKDGSRSLGLLGKGKIGIMANFIGLI